MNSEPAKVGDKVKVLWHDGGESVGVLVEVVGRSCTIRTERGGLLGSTYKEVKKLEDRL